MQNGKEDIGSSRNTESQVTVLEIINVLILSPAKENRGFKGT